MGLCGFKPSLSPGPLLFCYYGNSKVVSAGYSLNSACSICCGSVLDLVRPYVVSVFLHAIGLHNFDRVKGVYCFSPKFLLLIINIFLRLVFN